MTTSSLHIMLAVGTAGAFAAAWYAVTWIAAVMLVPVVLAALELDRRTA
jgi:hypothetical protein